jgi:zinc transport system ATP-binding protein
MAGRPSRREVDDALSRIGVGDLAGQQVHDLSGGELQRVLLARAMLRRPELLVLDEPTQGVDVAGQADLFRLIREVRDATGAGVLVISHDLHVVMAASDQVLCLNAHVCCAGTPESVVKHPEYVRLFGRRGADELAVFEHDMHHHRHHHAGHDHAGQSGHDQAEAG